MSYEASGHPEPIDGNTGLIFPRFPADYLPLTPEHMNSDTIVYADAGHFVIDRSHVLFIDGQAQLRPESIHPGTPVDHAIGLLCIEDIDNASEEGETGRFFVADIRRMVVGSIRTVSRVIRSSNSHAPGDDAKLFLPVSHIVAKDLDGGLQHYSRSPDRSSGTRPSLDLHDAATFLAATMDQAFDGDQLTLDYSVR